MGAFKGVGFPEDIADFFRIEDYSAYMWTAHNRFPTNTPGWWGGAHPFTILDKAVVHNGEITSYGTNVRWLEMFGYLCLLRTDTEVISYIYDKLTRRDGLSMLDACYVMAPSLWTEIDREKSDKKMALRQIYGGAVVNGPFGIVLSHQNGAIILNDRNKLRPVVCARVGDTYYASSEECSIRLLSPEVDAIWSPRGGEPVIVDLKPEAGEGVA
jgi:glutamate synthase domain-containing protein 1